MKKLFLLVAAMSPMVNAAPSDVYQFDFSFNFNNSTISSSTAIFDNTPTKSRTMDVTSVFSSSLKDNVMPVESGFELTIEPAAYTDSYKVSYVYKGNPELKDGVFLRQAVYEQSRTVQLPNGGKSCSHEKTPHDNFKFCITAKAN